VKPVEFTPDQLDALDVSRRDVDACIVAGPGSGKTTVLVEYFNRLVAAGADPLRILAITFTEKAAANMRKKLAEAHRDDARLRAHLERGWISTVHGFCARLLREHAISAGVDPEFRVADQRESWRMQQQCITDAIAELFRDGREDLLRLIGGLATAEFEQAALSAYDAMRGAGIAVVGLPGFKAPKGCTLEDVALALEDLCADPADGWKPAQRAHLDEIIEATERIVSAPTPLAALRGVQAFPANLTKCKRGTPAYDLVKRLRDEILHDVCYSLVTEHYARERELLIEALRRFDALYRERKLRAGMLDFADLEEYAVRLVRYPEARSRIQQQFDYVLMDEFQDTNPQQAHLLELLRRPGRFYAVGDINQSIFGFRHAEPDVFRTYRESIRTSGRVVDLQGNFRSRSDILLAVETVAAGSPGIEPRRLTAKRDFSEIDGDAPFVEFIHAFGADAECALENEAQWVARRILDLGTGFGRIVVLVRNTEVIGAFTAAFEHAGIPYVVSRGRGFYESREICDLVSLLQGQTAVH
jgi:superfamily I DNA/RNA helicase